MIYSTVWERRELNSQELKESVKNVTSQSITNGDFLISCFLGTGGERDTRESDVMNLHSA